MQLHFPKLPKIGGLNVGHSSYHGQVAPPIDLRFQKLNRDLSNGGWKYISSSRDVITAEGEYKGVKVLLSHDTRIRPDTFNISSGGKKAVFTYMSPTVVDAYYRIKG